MLAIEWLDKVRHLQDRIQETQMDNIQKSATLMADSIEAGRWVHTFGCGHATLPIEEMYPRIGGFVGFHPLIEQSLTFFYPYNGRERYSPVFIPGKGRRIRDSHHEFLEF